MSGQDWSIMIVPNEYGGGAVFKPDLMDSKPGDPLQTTNSDLVSWNNRTNDAHWPWPASSTYEPMDDTTARESANYLSDEIPAWQSSTPAYLCNAPTTGSTTIYYVCRLHPQEHGTLVVSAS